MPAKPVTTTPARTNDTVEGVKLRLAGYSCQEVAAILNLRGIFERIKTCEELRRGQEVQA